MPRDQMAGDVRYALGQLRRARPHSGIAQDCIERALDALERVEAALAGDALEPQLGEPWTTDEILQREG